ncbi:Protein transport protein SEC13 homolog B (SEC13-like protein B) [Durusdinium trenchii]
MASGINDAQYHGRTLATAHQDGTVHVAGAAPLCGHRGSATCLAWAEHLEGAPLLASGSADGHVIIWREMRPNDWQSIHQKYVPGSVKSLAFSCPEPLMLAVGGGDELGVLTLLVELRRGAMNPENWQVKSVPAHEGGIASLDWSPSSSPAVLATGPAVARAHGRWLGARRLATCGADGQLIIWRIDAKNDSFHREHVLDGDQIGGNDLWCSLSWRPNVGLPGNSLGAVSKEGEVMILSQDAEGMAFAPRQRWSLAQGAGCRLTWTKAGTLLAILVSPEKCVLFKESSSGEWKEIAAVDGS